MIVSLCYLISFHCWPSVTSHHCRFRRSYSVPRRTHRWPFTGVLSEIRADATDGRDNSNSRQRSPRRFCLSYFDFFISCFPLSIPSSCRSMAVHLDQHKVVDCSVGKQSLPTFVLRLLTAVVNRE